MNLKTTSFCSSTIGRKQLVGLSGLFLTLFVLGHVTGNLLVFVGAEAYNKYGHALVSNPAIYLVEAVLLLMLLFHFYTAIKLTLENAAAKGSRYAVNSKTIKGTPLVTKTMHHQGMIILVFIVLHLLTFKFGDIYKVTYDGVEIRDLFRLMVEVFQNPAYVVGYIFSMIVLMFHLSHGVSSALQTLGFNHPRYTSIINKIGWGVALYVSLGFIVQPLYLYFIYKG